jgi:RimJ/RimL family protein N-acetyltransferase
VTRVQAAPPAHHAWLAERAGLTLHAGFMALEAVREDGQIVGMVGFDGMCGTNDSRPHGCVTLHVAVEHPAALRHLLRAGFGAAFEAPPRGFGKVAAIATVRSDNRASLKLVGHLGFRHVHTGKDYIAPGVDLVYFELRKEHCRFIPWAVRRAA